MNTQTFASLKLETPKPGVTLLTLNRPSALNALTREMVAEVNTALDEIARDPECRVVILTGAGKGFCSGQDMKAADQRNREGASGVMEKMVWQENFSGMVRRLRALPQPVIAAINGPAAGAGMGLALGADIRIATATARFLIAAVRIGLSAGECGISYHLPRLIGTSRAIPYLLTGRPIDAEDAERLGLVSRIVEADQLLPEALADASEILANSPFSIAQTKRVMWQSVDAPSLDAALELENRTQILTTMTEDYREATLAFSERRAPNYKGR